MSAPISFLTDYGTSDGFVAACHGVIARIAPDARILDITHDVPPGDVRRGALVLAQTVPYLPAGVHVAVVDPGVGTARRAVAVRAGEHVFVGPDNGVLVWAADAVGGVVGARKLTNRDLMLPFVSATFHGRDVFAPVAAYLAIHSNESGGVGGSRAGGAFSGGSGPGSGGSRAAAFDALGPAVDPADLVRLPDPVAYVSDATAHGEVLTIDRFGNVQTSLTGDQLAELPAVVGDILTIRTADVAWDAVLARTFGDVTPSTLVAYLDSAGHLAFAVHGGDAAALTHVRPGDVMAVARRPAA
ncbi:SAM-dependent chlorinase/fluorinase [Yinghuangia sp. ASG 101]|uniref:SAM hydrolase/SAM-dependent halogenase family protein n=1 Tax=Yinghuangia sp. ASG 101 TaxID=2896848 RepID=UPI001E60BEAE|nr:SAM-dependent chlorinase/fluorinase [Yinghuangia sp. ASG 101]UGQ14839.1 SAM-dependent chlorinase/fluorinase [Yinghuangia sp. ASG 101]